MTTMNTAVPSRFWPQVDHQLDRVVVERSTTFDEVRAILLDPAYDEIVAEVNRNFQRHFDDNSAFFAGSGGDATLRSALESAGWWVVASQAPYYYSMVHRSTGETLTYIEGDVVRGDRLD